MTALHRSLEGTQGPGRLKVVVRRHPLMTVSLRPSLSHDQGTKATTDKLHVVGVSPFNELTCALP